MHALTLQCSYCGGVSLWSTERDRHEYCPAHVFIAQLKIAAWEHHAMADVQERTFPDALSIDPATVDNAVLKRLIEEVQHEHHDVVRAYDRVHNRHNRGPIRRPPPSPSPPSPPRPPQPEPDAKEDGP